MRLNVYIPRPSFSSYLCYPDMFGHYKEFSQHAERRTANYLPFYNLHFIFAGKGYVKEAGRWIELTAGNGFLYGKNLVQEYKADLQEPWDIRWIHFDGVGLEQLFAGKGWGAAWLFSFGKIDRFIQLTDDLYRLGEVFESTNEPKISAVLYEILVELLQNSEDLQGLSLLTYKDKIRRSADYIQANCTRSLKLEEMAAIAGYSSYYFNRMFHQIMDKTPFQYLLECRILHAKALLVSSRMSIKQIALESGFAQSSYFIQIFRRYEQVPPNEYRKMYS
ncbi:AraC family transcriptional regulator [Paenibacillus psychroresistens]|uniref:AraC family transcriptional regulator n=1 Tax=Paenibacillus psychroresistens TaxID=1778678 RepID=A0A6B8RIL1_9BACL|nr:AraC family transcriptional regulator [Paenibacillus psychroresistens]QGQ95373.1 AraC family transcriptional regulator [Paenibacillus psychroresistens]